MKEERNEDDEHQDYWLKRYRAPIPRADPYAEEDVNFRYRFGYNSTPFIYPLHMDTALAPLLQRPGSVEAHLPEKIIPQYNVTECCPHGNNFDPSDESLRMIFKSMSIITEDKDIILEREIYGRPSTGLCMCMSQADTHHYLLWNLGKVLSMVIYICN